MSSGCRCQATGHPPRRIVLTGGPGAGKTAVLAVVQKHFCPHLAVLPEAASIVFGGGFPRKDSDEARRAAQRAIYRIQVELERLVLEERQAAVTLCDRGTVDGFAYWPRAEQSFEQELGTTRVAELARYAAVIHLHPPGAAFGYNHDNPLRLESAEEAHRIDRRIAQAWAGHPRRFFVNPERDFMDKVAEVLELIRAEVPACCRSSVGRKVDAERSERRW
jgi:predicted ATPase